MISDTFDEGYVIYCKKLLDITWFGMSYLLYFGGLKLAEIFSLVRRSYKKIKQLEPFYINVNWGNGNGGFYWLIHLFVILYSIMEG